MRCILLLLLVCLACSACAHRGHSAASDEVKKQAKIDAECEYSRSDCIDCATRHADLDHDGRINQTEVDALKVRMISWVWRQIAWLARYTTPYIMMRCSDDEGYITTRSLGDKRATCLAHCVDWMRFMPMCIALDEHPRVYPHDRDTYYDDPSSRKIHGSGSVVKS